MDKTDCNGSCICVHCDIRIQHAKGVACRENVCPKCGKRMMREGSYHHQLYELKKREKNHESNNSDKTDLEI